MTALLLTTRTFDFDSLFYALFDYILFNLQRPIMQHTRMHVLLQHYNIMFLFSSSTSKDSEMQGRTESRKG